VEEQVLMVPVLGSEEVGVRVVREVVQEAVQVRVQEAVVQVQEEVVVLQEVFLNTTFILGAQIAPAKLEMQLYQIN
jgi:hypothetical protein